MKHFPFNNPGTDIQNPVPAKPQPPRRNLMFGKAVIIIGTCALAAYSTERLYEHLNERIELERNATKRMWQYTAAYSVNFWPLLAMHTR